ncbi:hypothetical protein H696_03612 [Fonticula alba]|uniref:ENTH domain-containing protein n=1 Tax=Fonticula alba TaxID=691883 RepID=A0A058Z8A2_FONAL|nr:hypothetical protein H696_03612 [Fonticula alba]KCV70153.1 hypothetical protein H696_03612 [Fonticula alba]|eukprot:XP_009495759.1 hypothetical protein H696_03612 [Fonticula alba]
MDHHLRSARRKTKNVLKGYSDAEAAVREATSNDPWGCPLPLYQHIASMTHDRQQRTEIMKMTFKRLNDHGRKWRHVTKALSLLEFLLKNGHPATIEWTKSEIHQLTTLREFQYMENGRDRGSYIRKKSMELAALLNDDPKILNEERARLREVNKRTASNTSSHARSMSSQGNTGAVSYERPANVSESAYFYNNDRDLQMALEASRESYEQEQRNRAKEEHDVQRAISESRKDMFTGVVQPSASAASLGQESATPVFSSEQQRTRQQLHQHYHGAVAADPTPAPTLVTQMASAGGSGLQPPSASARRRSRANSVTGSPVSSLSDPFSGAPAGPPPPVPVDPFAPSANDPFTPLSADPFTPVAPVGGVAGLSDPFGDPFAAPSAGSGASVSDPFAAPGAVTAANYQQHPQYQQALQQQQQQASDPFSMSFSPVGSGARQLAPHERASANTAAAALAQVARNAPQIDPFARQATDHSVPAYQQPRQQTAPPASVDPFATASTSSQPPSYGHNDPFASLYTGEVMQATPVSSSGGTPASPKASSGPSRSNDPFASIGPVFSSKPAEAPTFDRSGPKSPPVSMNTLRAQQQHQMMNPTPGGAGFYPPNSPNSSQPASFLPQPGMAQGSSMGPGQLGGYPPQYGAASHYQQQGVGQPRPQSSAPANNDPFSSLL